MKISFKSKKREEWVYFAIVFLIILFIFYTGLKNVGLQQRIRVIDDEFGYWGIAAHLAGYDWSDLLARTGYYSFGYSFVLVPFWWLYRLGISTACIYQLAVGLNVCMMVGGFLISIAVSNKLFPQVDRYFRLMASLISIFYYGYVTQMGIAWTEVYLMFMFWCLFYSILQVMERGTVLWYVLVLLSAANIFAIHMRALGVVVAAICICILNVTISEKKDWKKIILISLIACGIICVIVCMRNYTQEVIYCGNEYQNSNDFSGQMDKLKSLLSAGGIIDFVGSFCGKIYYLGVATYGCAILMLIYCVKTFLNICCKSLKIKKMQINVEEFGVLFLFLSVVGTVLIDALFQFFQYYSKGITNELADKVVYGRYVDFVVGPFLLCGILYLREKGISLKDVTLSIVIFFVSALVTQSFWDILIYYNGDEQGLRGTAIPGASYILTGNIERLAYVGFAWACVGALLFGILILGNFKGKYRNVGICICALGVCLFGLFKGNESIVGGISGKAHKEKTVESIVQLVKQSGIHNLTYVSGGGNVHGDLKILQWCLPEYSIRVIREEELDEVSLDTIYLADSTDVGRIAYLSEEMDYLYDSGVLAVFYPEADPQLLDLANAAACVVDPKGMNVDLAGAITEFSYLKENGSIYQSDDRKETYLTEKTGLILTDGVYEFEIALEFNYYTGEGEVGYITITDENGQYLDTRLLTMKDFDEGGSGKVLVNMPVQDYVEPIIGVYTYGNGAMKVNSISCKRICGNLSVESGREDEWTELVSIINKLSAGKPRRIWYVDSDGSSQSGFPNFANVNEMLEAEISGYISGQVFPYRSDLSGDYLIIERTGEYVDVLSEEINIIAETEHYILGDEAE